jgi:hypothetical protein
MASGPSGETKRISFFSEINISELPYLPKKVVFYLHWVIISLGTRFQSCP